LNDGDEWFISKKGGGAMTDDNGDEFPLLRSSVEEIDALCGDPTGAEFGRQLLIFGLSLLFRTMLVAGAAIDDEPVLVVIRPGMLDPMEVTEPIDEKRLVEPTPKAAGDDGCCNPRWSKAVEFMGAENELPGNIVLEPTKPSFDRRWGETRADGISQAENDVLRCWLDFPSGLLPVRASRFRELSRG
jgi:hypothetical protein